MEGKLPVQGTAHPTHLSRTCRVSAHGGAAWVTPSLCAHMLWPLELSWFFPAKILPVPASFLPLKTAEVPTCLDLRPPEMGHNPPPPPRTSSASSPAHDKPPCPKGTVSCLLSSAHVGSLARDAHSFQSFPRKHLFMCQNPAQMTPPL